MMWRELVAYGRHIFFATSILRLGEQAADTLIVGRGLGKSPYFGRRMVNGQTRWHLKP